MTTDGDFSWDSKKSLANEAAHGVSFAEACTMFADPHVAIVDDGANIRRYKAIGYSIRDRVLMVVHVEEDGDRIRIIGAWRATAAERRLYE